MSRRSEIEVMARLGKERRGSGRVRRGMAMVKGSGEVHRA